MQRENSNEAAEAAAVYCMKKKEYHIGVGCKKSIFIFFNLNLQIKQIVISEGDFCGGSFVDDEFLKFIGEKVGESALKLQYMVQDFCRRVKT
ncbi:hypothetical protein RhiirA5_435980 [Rhizophagus irregularis]|uniref:Uncharacterized protein n=1 Tax=Rhizophagus irregularis TaxID=588596 RepID=A0A2N0NML4_9GLOM|nr:hypothetical protein RhiirA5_435980 [Rhizophagus irregularis]